MFIRLNKTPECDEKTDRRTDRRNPVASTAPKDNALFLGNLREYRHKKWYR